MHDKQPNLSKNIRLAKCTELANFVLRHITMAAAAQPAADCEAHWSLFLATMTAMMMWHVAIPIAPTARTGLRPSRSTYSTAGMVATNMTMPTTPVARRLVSVLPSPRSLKMVGA